MEKRMRTNSSRQNRADVLNIIRKEGAMSRVDIAEQVSLTKPTITVITNDMLTRGLLVEKGMKPTNQTLSRGRRKTLLDINESYKLAFGVAVDKDRLCVGLTNLMGQALAKSSVSIENKQYREVLEAIVNEITMLFKSNYIPAAQVLGVGICISEGCADFIESSDKLTRIKRDLSHAITFKITAETTINAILQAEQLFRHGTPDSMLVLRYGEIIENGVWINGDVYRSSSQKAGGFRALQMIGQETSYERFRRECAGRDVNECQKLLNAKLANDIGLCHQILDTEAVIAVGNYFEEQLDAINSELKNNGGMPLLPGVITEGTLYLAGCALVIDQYYYKIGGY